MNNPLDREKLILIQSKKEKGLSFFEWLEHKRLLSLYPDNEKYRGKLEEVLREKGYMKIITDAPPHYQDENGDTIVPKGTYCNTVICKNGINALKRGLIKSETNADFTATIERRSMIIIALITLILTIIFKLF